MAHEPSEAALMLSPRLLRLFDRACTQLGRDADDVFSEMLDVFLKARHIAEPVTSGGPLSPPPGPVDDPTQPHHHPFCHNAHEQIRNHRIGRRVERIEQLTGGEIDPPVPATARSRSPLVTAHEPVLPSHHDALRQVEHARHRRDRARRAIDDARSARRREKGD